MSAIMPCTTLCTFGASIMFPQAFQQQSPPPAFIAIPVSTSTTSVPDHGATQCRTTITTVPTPIIPVPCVETTLTITSSITDDAVGQHHVQLMMPITTTNGNDKDGDSHRYKNDNRPCCPQRHDDPGPSDDGADADDPTRLPPLSQPEHRQRFTLSILCIAWLYLSFYLDVLINNH